MSDFSKVLDLVGLLSILVCSLLVSSLVRIGGFVGGTVFNGIPRGSAYFSIIASFVGIDSDNTINQLLLRKTWKLYLFKCAQSLDSFSAREHPV